MNESEVRRQLQNMVAFIEQEAHEKATELRAKAKEDFAIEKSRLVQAGQKKIQKEFDSKEKQVDVQRKIAFSNEMNASRLSVLSAREECIQAILAETHGQLAAVGVPGPAYEGLLRGLLVQGLEKMIEGDVTVVCRKEDVAMVEKVLPGALETAQKKAPKVTATLTDKFYLAAGPSSAGDANAEFCSGGVLLSANGGKILCNQTLDHRLSLAYKGNLPTIRDMLFGENPNRKYRD